MEFEPVFGLGGGSSSSYNVVQFDNSILSAYYNSKNLTSLVANANSSSSTSTAALNSFAELDNLIPPWDSSQEQLEIDDRLRKALSTSNFVNLKDSTLGASDMNEDYRGLFAVYKGLNLLSAIAGHASDKSTSDLRLTSLDREFQEGMGQVFDFLNSYTPDGFIVAAGEQSDKVDADVAIARPLSQFSTGIIQNGAPADPVIGLAGTETFDIAITKSGATTNVAIDLSDIAGDLHLNAIADHINVQLEAAGMGTRFVREKIEIQPTVDDGDIKAADRDPIVGYGLKVEGLSTEVMNFSSAAATGAVYVSGVSGFREDEGGQLLKLTDIESGDPTIEGGARITSEGDGTAKVGASAMDEFGNTYLVGSTTGDMGSFHIGEEQDVFLSKYDSAGNLTWQRMLGATDTADGFAIEVDANNNVVIAGSVTGQLTEDGRGGGVDSFVTKYNSEGAEVFTRQVAPTADDSALALAIAADGSIYVSGQTSAALASGLTYSGGTDAYITKLDDAGELIYNRQFGGANDDKITSIAVAADGNLIVGGEIKTPTSKDAFVRKFDESDGTSAAIWDIDLGDMEAGALNAIAVDGNKVYVVGATSNASLDAGGTGTINGTHAGVQDGFIFEIDDSGNSAAAVQTTYIGSENTDRIYDIKVSGGDLYIAGDTLGGIGGETLSGDVDGFAAKLSADGTMQWTHQYRGYDGYGSARGIEVDQAGSSVLDVLGFPAGQMDFTSSRTVTARTTARAGQYFEMSVDGGKLRKIEIEEGDTLRAVARKIQNVLLLDGTSRSRRTSNGDTLRIEGNKGVRIDLVAGEGEMDALRGLGLEPGTIYNDGSLLDVKDEDEEEIMPFYGLGLKQGFSLATKEDAAIAAKMLQDVMGTLRKAFNDLTRDPALDDLLAGGNKANGPVPAYLQSQLANYSAGLERLTGGGGSTLGFF